MAVRQLVGRSIGTLLVLVVAVASEVGAATEVRVNRETSNGNKIQQAEQQHDQRQQEPQAQPSSPSRPPSGGAVSYLLAQSQLPDGSHLRLNMTSALDSTLSSILNRTGPDMRPLRDFRDFDDITLEVAKRAWRLMHHHALTAMSERVQLIRPFVGKTLTEANVSAQCVQAAKLTLDAAQRLDSWAIQMLTSWGSFPPTGIYEGTFGDIGSFHGCLNVPESRVVGHAHYCTIAYRPVLPTRRDYELIVRKEPEELLHLFDRDRSDRSMSEGSPNETSFDGQEDKPDEDAFSAMLRKAQYNHYVYYKFGTCFPIQCTPYDVQRIAKLLGRRSILMSGPVKCHSKFSDDYERTSDGTELALQVSTRDLNDGVYIWKPHMTRTQAVALALVSLLALSILFLTFLDVTINRLPAIYQQLVRPHAKPASGEGQTEDLRENGSARAQDPDERTAFRLNQANEQELELSRKDLNNNKATCPHLSSIHVASSTVRAEEERKKKPVVSDAALDVDASVAFSTPALPVEETPKQRSLFKDILDDYSIVTNAKQFFQVSQVQMKNDILCINGIRCITMSWIIITHTMQYNDWSAFARTHEIETHLNSLINQPLFNGSYLVDTFFLISGLLTSFSSFSRASTGNWRGILSKFSARSYLVGRYLRLTPQILFISLLFILLPLISRTGSPHWYTITGEYSENCAQNWWVNLFHIQAFYRSHEMCNFVCWWISVDMFYHLFALAIILLVLHGAGHHAFLPACLVVAVGHVLVQARRHYLLGMPPNLLSTIPQTGAMWSEMTLKFFWTPYAHAFPFFLGLYLGYLMAQRASSLAAWLSPKRATLGWLLAITLLILQSYSTYFWVTGMRQYTRLVSTAFYLACPLVWAACLGWIIVACQYGYGGWVARALSCRLFIILGKASYVVYLSHFLVLFTFFGSQNLLLEPTQLVMLYVVVGNICLSMLLGSVLCVVFEMPWLKTQRRLMKYVR